VGTVVLTVGLFTFAFSTILGWSYYGEQCAEYLWGVKSNYPYRVIYCIFVLLGTVASLGIVWSIADILNALMALPNIIAVLLLSNEVAKITKHYVWENNMEEEDTTPIPLRSEIK
jgi:AGCS family alanine or glycine:cation symporter